MTINKFNYILIFISILCSVHFFGLSYRLSDKFDVLIDLFFVMSSILFFYVSVKNPVGKLKALNSNCVSLYNIYFIIFFLLLLTSVFSCLYFHGQNVFRTMQSMRFFLYFYIFFMLINSNVTREELEKVCYLLALVYCIVFMIQMFIHPIAIVPLGKAEEFDRGFLRLRLEGVGFVTLIGMLSLNKYLSSQKIKHILILSSCLFFIYLLGFRTLLLTYLISLIFIVFFYKNIVVAVLSKMLFFCSIVILYQSGLISDFVDESFNLTMNQLDNIDDYIRVLTYNFLFEDINPNYISLIFGNGFPYLESKYGYDVLYVGSSLNGFIAADLGLIGFSFYFGILTTFIYIIILLTPMIIKFNKDVIYLKVYGFYLVISSFTTAEAFRIGMFGVICIYLYFVVSEARDERIK